MYDFIKVNDELYYVEGNENEPCPKIFLIAGKESSLLIDVGNKIEQVNSLYEGIKKYNLSPLKYIVITHFHDDHLHNINEFKDKEIIVSKQTSKYIPFKVTIFIEKITLNLGDLPLIIDDLPNSHAKGSLLVYLPNSKMMFVGDALAGRILGDSYTINRSLTFELNKKLKEYEVNTYVEGHPKFSLNNAKMISEEIENYNRILKETKGDNIEIKEDF